MGLVDCIGLSPMMRTKPSGNAKRHQGQPSGQDRPQAERNGYGPGAGCERVGDQSSEGHWQLATGKQLRAERKTHAKAYARPAPDS
jgi:hypothetical protein